MTRKPKTSTLNNFTTAWYRVIATAVERGFISERVPMPKLQQDEGNYDCGQVGVIVSLLDNGRCRTITTILMICNGSPPMPKR
jgi:hypothetical protein